MALASDSPTRSRRARRFQRGALLAAVASVYTTGLVGVPPAPAIPEIEMHTTELGGDRALPGFDREVDAGLDSELVAADWSGAVEGQVQVRARQEEGWSEWLPLEGRPDEGPDPGSIEDNGRTAAGPIWVGDDVRDLEVRVTEGPLVDLKLHSIDSPSPDQLATTTDTAGAATQPGITSRGAWGADESFRSFAPGCDGNPDYADNVRNAFVHHTVNSNDYSPEDAAALVRGIYYFHTHTNKWCDIGYNFLVDRYGQVFEGRAGGIDQAVIGAHAGGFNTASTGVALIGSYQDSDVPPPAFSSLASLLAWKLERHGVDPAGQVPVTSSGSNKYAPGTVVTLPTVASHRDVTLTACPGDRMYGRLGELRSEVVARTATAPPPPPPPADPPAVAGLLGGLLDLVGRLLG